MSPEITEREARLIADQYFALLHDHGKSSPGIFHVAEFTEALRRLPLFRAAQPQPSVADGYAVLLFDKASAPGGYWFAGIYRDKESADRLAAKNGKCEVRPMVFAATQPEQVKA